MARIKDENGRRIGVLTFSREQLLYDIRNLGYVEGDIMSEEAPHPRHNTQDICEEGNVDRVTRQLNLLEAIAIEMLYPYSKRELRSRGHADVWDDTLYDRDEYRIVMDLPEGFSPTTLNLLEHLIHEWMVARVMYDWLGITNPEKSAVWKVKSDELEQEIKSAGVHRGCLRRKCTPF